MLWGLWRPRSACTTTIDASRRHCYGGPQINLMMMATSPSSCSSERGCRCVEFIEESAEDESELSWGSERAPEGMPGSLPWGDPSRTRCLENEAYEAPLRRFGSHMTRVALALTFIPAAGQSPTRGSSTTRARTRPTRRSTTAAARRSLARRREARALRWWCAPARSYDGAWACVAPAPDGRAGSPSLWT